MSPTAAVTHPHRPAHAGRSLPLAAVALASVALAATAGALATRLVAVWPDVLATRLRWPAPSAVEIDSLIAAPLLAIGVALAAWWSLSLLLITASLVAERAGRRSTALLRCVHAVAPRTLRRLAVTGLGAGLAFSSLPAQAAEEPPDLGWTTTQPATGPAPRHGKSTVPPPVTEPTALPVNGVTPRDLPTATPSASAPGAPDRTAHGDPVDPTSLGALSPLAVPGTLVDASGVTDQPTSAPTAPAASATPPAPPTPSVPVVPSAPPETVPAAPPAPVGSAPAARSAGGDTGSGSDHSGSASSGSASTTDSGTVRPDLAPGVVVVAPGDTLWDLAATELPTDATNAQIASSWHAWYALNAAVIGDDPDLLRPGQLLQVPPAP